MFRILPQLLIRLLLILTIFQLITCCIYTVVFSKKAHIIANYLLNLLYYETALSSPPLIKPPKYNFFHNKEEYLISDIGFL